MSASVAPNPGRIHQALTAYQLSQALKGAIELNLFTEIAAGHATPAALALRCGGTERSQRILCDYLTVHGFLSKENGQYDVLPDTAPLLDATSPLYMGQVAGFFLHPSMVRKYNDVASLVREGAATDHTLGANEHMWVEFARSMAPMFTIPASKSAEIVATPGKPQRVLDVAAGHGLFGIHVGLRNLDADITFQDWANVLEVARENVEHHSMTARARFQPGSFFEVDLGSAYDLVLLPNFIHHFDRPTNVGLLRKVHAALAPGGTVAIIEFVPGEDRITPPDAAVFAMRMLGTTPSGDAYTLSEIEGMVIEAGFGAAQPHSLSPAHQQLVVAPHD
jgi:SAM-dependent methyltransferase